jgi:glycosyltransferase involved in cell wall biosynthesis
LIVEFPDLHFLFVGDGSLRQTLEAQAEAGGFRDRISFAGLIPPAQVYRYVAQMDILVHFSLREGLPRAVVQGLASGKPAVAYNLDGTPEVVLSGKTGFLVEPGDTAGIRDALNILLTDDDARIRMGQNGRALVRDLFGWKRMADILMNDYENELAKKRINSR